MISNIAAAPTEDKILVGQAGSYQILSDYLRTTAYDVEKESLSNNTSWCISNLLPTHHQKLHRYHH